MANVSLRGLLPLSPARRLALGTWGHPSDPSVYGTLRLRAEPIEAWMAAARAASGRRITLTPLVLKALAQCLSEHPEVNARLRFNGIHLRQQVSIFVHVALEDPITGQLDLSGVTVHDADQKALATLLDEIDLRIAKVRAGTDAELARGRDTFRWLPVPLVRPLVQLLKLLSVELNLDLRFMGVARDPFGSLLLTNVGALGLDEAWAPLVGYSGVPLVVALGAAHDAAIVEDGEVVPARILPLYATFDHRILDGAHAARLTRTLKRLFADPAAWLGDPSALPAADRAEGA